MNVLLCQLDGKIPNLALMRISAHHRNWGDYVTLAFGAQFERGLWDNFDRVYASAIFAKSKPLIERLFHVYPNAVVGGTGYDLTRTVESIGITSDTLDYSIYPRFEQSIGFTQRGCRLKCEFCVVPKKEGRVRPEKTIAEIWRGDPWPKELLLLDNDFFGHCRCLTEEAAEAIASIDYRDDSMKVKRIYTAWDSREDEDMLFRGLGRLVKYGVKPDHIMVYMLVGYWPTETAADREYRRLKLREFGARPYPMPYQRTTELLGFQRWIIGAYDKRVPWDKWVAAKYEPRNLGVEETGEVRWR